MTQATKTRKQTEIQSAAIYRCTSKETGEVFYMVKSDSSDAYYKVTWNEQVAAWQCPCPNKSVRPCKHGRAVTEVQAVRFAKPVSQVEAPVCSELKTVFSSMEEEYEYRLHAYGKKSAVHWAYEQKQHTTVEVVPTGKAEQVAAVAEVQAEAKMDTFKAAMEVEETRASYMRHFYDAY